jgi:hypothetical protein
LLPFARGPICGIAEDSCSGDRPRTTRENDVSEVEGVAGARTRASGGTGRRAWLRAMSPQGGGGSSPPSPTEGLALPGHCQVGRIRNRCCEACRPVSQVHFTRPRRRARGGGWSGRRHQLVGESRHAVILTAERFDLAVVPDRLKRAGRLLRSPARRDQGAGAPLPTRRLAHCPRGPGVIPILGVRIRAWLRLTSTCA